MGIHRDETPPRRAPPFVRSAFLTYGTHLAVAVMSLANVLVVARVLGSEGRGNVAFLTAIAWLLASVSTLGTQEANANLAAAEPSSRRSLATNSLLLSLVFGACAVGVVTGLIAVFPGIAGESDPTHRWFTFGFLPVLILLPLLRLLVQADYGFAVANGAYLLGSVVNIAVNGAFAGLGILSVGTAIGVWLGGQALEAAVLAWYIARHLAGFGRPDLALARRALRFGVRAHTGRVMQLANYRLDQWILGALSGPRELGLYSVAVAWAEALWFLPTALATVQRPRLVRADRRDAARQAAAVFRAVTLVTAALAAVMVALAPFLCVVVFGEEFRGSIDDLRVLVAGAFGMVALKLFGNALVAQNRPGLQSLAIGAGFLFTLVLDIVLIPPYGGLGAALASTVAYAAAGVVVGAIFVRALEGRPSDLVPRPADAARFVQIARGRLRPSLGRGT